MLFDAGFTLLSNVSYPSLKSNDKRVVAILARIVDIFLKCGSSRVTDAITIKLQEHFEFGTIAHGPGLLRYFVLKIIQYNHSSVSINENNMLEALSAHPLTTVLRHEFESHINNVERKAFISICSAM